jgi:hypothetical protein
MGKSIEALLWRAAEIAETGAYPDWTGVARHLREEGSADAEDVLREESLRRQIDAACSKACHAQGT